jgi:hypothetical protein
LQSTFSFASALVDLIIKNENQDYDGMNDSTSLNLFHLVNSHLLARSRKASDEKNSISQREKASFQNILQLIVMISIISSIIVLIFMFYLPYQYDHAYSTPKVLLRRLPPSAIVNDANLHKYILFQSKSTKNQMSLGKKVIHESLSPILIHGRLYHVENANSAFAQTFNYRTEEITGQSFSSTEKPKTKIEDSIEKPKIDIGLKKDKSSSSEEKEENWTLI